MSMNVRDLDIIFETKKIVNFIGLYGLSYLANLAELKNLFIYVNF